MKVFKKAFRGVPNGEIYPVDYAAGDECPAELFDAATEDGAIADDKEAAEIAKADADKVAADAKAAADAEKNAAK